MIIRDSVVTYAKETARQIHSYNRTDFNWQDVIIIGILFISVFCLVRLILNYCLQKKIMKAQREYDKEFQKRKQDLEKRRWDQKEKLTEELLKLLNTNKELNNKYIEDLEKLIGIANDNNSK